MIKNIKSKIMLMFILACISVSSVFADYSATMTGYFLIGDQVIYGTLSASSISIEGDSVVAHPPWKFESVAIVIENEIEDGVFKIPHRNERYIVNGNENMILTINNAPNKVNSFVDEDLDITYNSMDKLLQIISTSKPIDVNVFDLSGKIVYSTTNSTSVNIIPNHLTQTEGVYFLKITSEDGVVIRKFVISDGEFFISTVK